MNRKFNLMAIIAATAWGISFAQFYHYTKANEAGWILFWFVMMVWNSIGVYTNRSK